MAKPGIRLVREMLSRAESDTAGGRASYRPDGLPAVRHAADGLYRLSDGRRRKSCRCACSA
jgi:DNA gyrase subunit A